MLPIAADNGVRLAAILPTGLYAIARGQGLAPHDAISAVDGDHAIPAAELTALDALVPPLRGLAVIAVDGLGTANLKARAGHAPVLSGLPRRRITTVVPSTTSAALTTLTTGSLPAAHGLIGYRIAHPELGFVSPLRDWEGIDDPRSWQLAPTLFEAAARIGLRSSVFGRPAHAESGFTRAMLTGAEFRGGERVEDRFAAAKQELADGGTSIAYVYIDELDRAGHRDGWTSDAWTRRLEQLDRALGDFLTSLPEGIGVVLTADHGMVDVLPEQQVVLDLAAEPFAGVVGVGGEPRFRSFHLARGVDPDTFAARLQELEGHRAWVATRDEAFAAGWFGPAVAHGVPERLGEVLLAARGAVAYYTSEDSPRAMAMIGQHGSLTDEEIGIPLVLAGALAGTGFAKAIERMARARSAAG